MAQPKNLIFWGAGATAALGIRTTARQSNFIRLLADSEGLGTPLAERIRLALDGNGTEQWHSALYDLITILGDSDDNYIYIDHIGPAQIEAMRRNWIEGANEEELKHRIIELRLFYDWPALKSVVRICPASDSSRFKINDLWNVLDIHSPSNSDSGHRPREAETRRARDPRSDFTTRGGSSAQGRRFS
jgi:hypothetical protein